MIEDFINKLYESTIVKISKDIDIEFLQEFKDSYKKMLFNIYQDAKIVDGKFDEALNGEIDYNIKFYNAMSVNERLSFCIYDEAYERILNHFNDSAKLAIEKYNNPDIMEIISLDDVVKEMEELTTKVKKFNYPKAIKCLKEATYNYKYALGMTKFLSASTSNRI